jgi:hypothetical protein
MTISVVIRLPIHIIWDTELAHTNGAMLLKLIRPRPGEILGVIRGVGGRFLGHAYA